METEPGKQTVDQLVHQLSGHCGACYLGELTGDKTWYDKALTIYEGQRKLLFNASTGEVWDCRAWNPDGTMESGGNRWVSTYNQGTMLGAACALYEYTKDEMYIEDAKKIYERSRDHLTNSNKIISVCQTINGDLCGFKGILMRYVRRYAEMQHLEEPMLWLEKNAWHAYQNRTSKGVIWSAWLTKTDESLKRMEGDSQKDVNNDAFGSSTAVSVAFNAHVNRQFCKSAASGLEARYFDELQFTQLDDVLADEAALRERVAAMMSERFPYYGMADAVFDSSRLETEGEIADSAENFINHFLR